jgi:hypothetical protein
MVPNDVRLGVGNAWRENQPASVVIVNPAAGFWDVVQVERMMPLYRSYHCRLRGHPTV